MNANSKPLAPTINSWLDNATTQLSAVGIPTARLDAELMLSHQLQQSRTWLIAHQNDNIIDLNTLENASKLLEKRLHRVPIAYITNHKEFYNRSFFVNESVLIPRPESETIIELLEDLLETFEEDVAASQPSATGVQPRRAASEKEEGSSSRIKLLDIGTGSGALGITTKLEFPHVSVTVSDISEEALRVARKNAKVLGATPLRYAQSDLLEHWLSHSNPKKFDIIVANLPYVDHEWERSPETDHEPALALFADDHGLALIKKCMQQASILTSVGGYLLLEADPEQHSEIQTLGAMLGFTTHSVVDYIVVLKRT